MVTAGSGVMLTSEGLVVNVKKPKHNFTLTTLTKVLVTLWAKDDLVSSLSDTGCSTLSFYGLLLDGGEARRLLYGDFRYGVGFPAHAVAGRLTDFTGRYPWSYNGRPIAPGDSSVGSISSG
jgi:hypothetical protein